MKSFTEYLPMFVDQDSDFLNITPLVEAAVLKSGIQEGLCLVNSMHVSAAVFVHYGGQAVGREVQKWIDWMGFFGTPEESQTQVFFQPPAPPEAEGRARTRQMLGREVVLAVTRGRLDLGPSEQVFYAELDGGREKRVLVKIIGE